MRHKRTRTGCERCRGQRRKCDEGKPRCERCVNAGVPCKYRTNVSFLQKNSKTLFDDDPSGPSLKTSSSAPSYPTLEFIVDDNSSNQARTENAPEAVGSATKSTSKGSATSYFDPIDWDSAQVWPLVGESSLSHEEAGLLKYYCHRVAPWLDVFDPVQTYRRLYTGLAMNCPTVLEQLLKLSAVFSGRSTDIVRPRGTARLHLQAMARPPTSDSPFSNIRIMAGFVLTRTLTFCQDVPGSWSSSFLDLGIIPRFDKFKVTDPVDRSIWLGFVVQMLKLEIAYSLVQQTAPAVAFELAAQISDIREARELDAKESQTTYKACLVCLSLLAETMVLCLPLPSQDDEGNIAPRRSAQPLSKRALQSVEWKSLLGRLMAWHTNRPAELRPLVEFEDRGSPFPTVIFCSGAGISSNVLFHTAMALLLSQTPQPAPLGEWRAEVELPSAQTSPLWHASRICGIATHSEPESTLCWDPCMISAFAFAARLMTDADQQCAVGECLGRVKKAGWRVDDLVDRLRDEWAEKATSLPR